MTSNTLYRPVGLAEMALIFDLDLQAFPPRLPDQPIFYPVLNREYAVQIARDWNAPSDQCGYCGYVTRFEVDAVYLESFEEQIVGGRTCKELWIPSEELEVFNQHIIGPITVSDVFFGEKFKGFVPRQFLLREQPATMQLVTLAATLEYSGMDFICETQTNSKAIYLNAPYWESVDFSTFGVTDTDKGRVISSIKKMWQERRPTVPFST